MKVKKSAFFTRTVKAKLTFEEDGERKTEEFRVVYRSMTPARAREVNEMQEAANKALETNPNDKDAKQSFAKALALLVESIPDIVEGEEGAETPIRIDGEVLDSLFDWTNLAAINEAITADTNPKQSPSEV